MPPALALFAACQPGLEPFLADELRALGASPQAQRGGVAFAGDTNLLLRAGLWLGTASHLLIRLAKFPCRALGELERKAKDLPWRDWLRPHVPLQVHATTRGSRIYHTGAAAERVTNAIAAHMGRSLRAPAKDDEVFATVHVRLRDDECTISFDATCDPLHRRGYRLDGRKAPLREDLAHALVLASGWQPGQALLDPFCGSGTIPIEAAAIARGLPPGRLRSPALQHLAAFDADAWEAVRKERRSATATEIAAGDRDAGAVGACRANAERAGVADAIQWHEGAVSTHPWLQGAGAPAEGTVVTNPPFGLRVQKADGLLPLYQTLGHRIAALGAGWRAAILAHDVRLCRRTGLPLQAAFTSKHGGLSVTALVGPAVASADRPRGSDRAD
jgi:putative N6-adenine-specific DNA methylase